MNVGDIHWVDFPQANGREQQGRRPAIVLQDDGYAGSLPTTLVIPLSITYVIGQPNLRALMTYASSPWRSSSGISQAP